MTQCGGSVKQNCTIVQTPVYPSAYKTSGTCTHTIDKVDASQEICSVRLDFIDHRVSPGEVGGTLGVDAGDCKVDVVSFT